MLNIQRPVFHVRLECEDRALFSLAQDSQPKAPSSGRRRWFPRHPTDGSRPEKFPPKAPSIDLDPPALGRDKPDGQFVSGRRVDCKICRTGTTLLVRPHPAQPLKRPFRIKPRPFSRLPAGERVSKRAPVGNFTGFGCAKRPGTAPARTNPNENTFREDMRARQRPGRAIVKHPIGPGS